MAVTASQSNLSGLPRRLVQDGIISEEDVERRPPTATADGRLSSELEGDEPVYGGADEDEGTSEAPGDEEARDG